MVLHQNPCQHPVPPLREPNVWSLSGHRYRIEPVQQAECHHRHTALERAPLRSQGISATSVPRKHGQAQEHKAYIAPLTPSNPAHENPESKRRATSLATINLHQSSAVQFREQPLRHRPKEERPNPQKPHDLNPHARREPAIPLTEPAPLRPRGGPPLHHALDRAGHEIGHEPGDVGPDGAALASGPADG